MHAVAAAVRNEDPGLARTAPAELRLDLIPKAPGFSAHTGWTDRRHRHVIVVETKDHAKDAVAYPFPSLPRVTARTIETREACSST